MRAVWRSLLERPCFVAPSSPVGERLLHVRPLCSTASTRWSTAVILGVTATEGVCSKSRSSFNGFGLGSTQSRLRSWRVPSQSPQRSQNHSRSYRARAQQGQTSTRRERHIGCGINFASTHQDAGTDVGCRSYLGSWRDAQQYSPDRLTKVSPLCRSTF